MTEHSNTHIKLIQWTHRIGVWEGISYVILLFIAMPLKYFMDYKEAVRLTGSAHGFLFVAFMIALYYSLHAGAINRKQIIRAILLSLIPFGTFYLSFDKSVN